jgi:DNA repair protein RecO (recombination protein O)
MNRYITKGIVLGRANFGEADRIVTFLTPTHGKVRAMAKGVRKTKSKLAGAIELFGVSDLTILVGKGEIQTLMSGRLDKHFGQIVKDIDRTTAAYDAIKLINKATEDQPEEAYFNLLEQALESLNDSEIEPQLTGLWLAAQLLKLGGHTPNLKTDASGKKLAEDSSYDFELDAMRFRTTPAKTGEFNPSQIKFLRLCFAAERPHLLQRVQTAPALAATVQPLAQSMLKTFFQI